MYYFDKTPSAVEIRRIGRALSVVANKMESFPGDLFIDLGKICGLTACGQNAIILVGKSHADEITRFYECIAEREKTENGITTADAFAECDRTLGWDYAVVFNCGDDDEKHIDDIIIINNTLPSREAEDISKRIEEHTASPSYVMTREEAERKYEEEFRLRNE